MSALFLCLMITVKAQASSLIEYHMHLPPSGSGKRVALTFDACTGKVDGRILDALVTNRIKATIFVTARWLRRNPAAIATLKANSDLFEIENHGARHVPAIDVPKPLFGLAPAGSPEAVRTEVKDGAAAIAAVFGHQSQWFRGAGAEYTAKSIELIRALNFRIAGFSASGDGGATWSETHAASALEAAKDGDILIAHINQPTKPAGAGVVKGIQKLKQQGFTFVTLGEAFASGFPRHPEH